MTIILALRHDRHRDEMSNIEGVVLQGRTCMPGDACDDGKWAVEPTRVWLTSVSGGVADVEDGVGSQKVVQAIGVGIERRIQLLAHRVVHVLRKRSLAQVNQRARNGVIHPDHIRDVPSSHAHIDHMHPYMDTCSEISLIWPYISLGHSF